MTFQFRASEPTIAHSSGLCQTFVVAPTSAPTHTPALVSNLLVIFTDESSCVFHSDNYAIISLSRLPLHIPLVVCCVSLLSSRIPKRHCYP
jgi:hypothetical protein